MRTTRTLDASDDDWRLEWRPMTWPEFSETVGALLADRAWAVQMAANVGREPGAARALLDTLGELAEGLRALAVRPDVTPGQQAAVLAGCDTLDRALATVEDALEGR